MKKAVLVLILFVTVLSSSAQVSYSNIQKGLRFQAEDKSALIKVAFRAQNLFTYDNNFESDDPEMKAMLRRMRLKFGGYLVNPNFEYKLEIGFSNRDIGNRKDETQVNNASKMVLDAVLKYHINEHHAIWFGQTKLPGNRERVISSQALQFVDRSNVNSKFNIDRDFGVQYRYKNALGDMPVTLAAAVSTGEGRNVTITNDGGLSYTGRLELFPLGSFTKKGAYFGADLMREEKPKLAIAASYNFNQQTNRSGGQLGSFVLDDSADMVFNDLTTLFVDAMFKYNGWSLMSEYAIRTVSDKVDGFNYGNGFVAQLGYLFQNNMEVAGRYTTVDLQQAMGATKNTTEYTLSLSNYIVAHKLKWQTDIALLNENDYRFRFQLEFGI